MIRRETQSERDHSNLYPYTPGQNLILEKYDGYWQKGLPYLDRVEFKFTPDVDTAFMELQAGTIDILKYLTTAQAQSLSSEYNLVEGSMNLVHGMYLNSGYEPLSNAKGAPGSLLCRGQGCNQ